MKFLVAIHGKHIHSFCVAVVLMLVISHNPLQAVVHCGYHHDGDDDGGRQARFHCCCCCCYGKIVYEMMKLMTDDYVVRQSHATVDTLLSLAPRLVTRPTLVSAVVHTVICFGDLAYLLVFSVRLVQSVWEIEMICCVMLNAY